MPPRFASLCLLALCAPGCASDADRDTVPVTQDRASANADPGETIRRRADGAVGGFPSVAAGPSRTATDAAVGGLDASSAAGALDSGQQDAAAAAYACSQNYDCVVKDVGSCCGYYPRCANLGATFGPPSCNNGQVGLCSFPSIDHCECQQNRCVSVPSSVQGSQQF